MVILLSATAKNDFLLMPFAAVSGVLDTALISNDDVFVKDQSYEGSVMLEMEISVYHFEIGFLSGVVIS